MKRTLIIAGAIVLAGGIVGGTLVATQDPAPVAAVAPPAPAPAPAPDTPEAEDPEVPATSATECELLVSTTFDTVVDAAVVGDVVVGSLVADELRELEAGFPEQEFLILTEAFTYYFDYPAPHGPSVTAAYEDVVVPGCAALGTLSV